MDGNKLGGILIILVLIISISIIGVNSFTSLTHTKDTSDTVSNVLSINDLNKNNSTNSTVSVVNLNFNQKTGSTKIKFIDTDNICNITSKSQTNKSTNVSYTKNGEIVDVNVDSNDTSNAIILSNKYVYNINGVMTLGGISTEIGNNSKIDTLNLNVTLGGEQIKLNDESVNTINTNVNTGGVSILGTPSGQTTLNSKITVGGLNVQLKQPIAYINSKVNLGGTSTSGYQKISNLKYKGNSFDSSSDKLIINSQINVGGFNIK